MRNNVVLHCQEGTSDKIYIWAVREKGDGWEVVGKWGRRGKNVSEQNKGHYAHWEDASIAAQAFAKEKEKKGYVNIRSAGYVGSLTIYSPEVEKFLEPEIELDLSVDDDLTSPTVSEPKIAMPKLKSDEVCVAECLDNTGMEGFFDEGIDYIIESLEDGPEEGSQMMLVIDSNGLSKGCYRNRFGKFKVE
jgi:predicted DNA-binding WGR domain protein